jgi:hypothetical protein
VSPIATALAPLTVVETPIATALVALTVFDMPHRGAGGVAHTGHIVVAADDLDIVAVGGRRVRKIDVVVVAGHRGVAAVDDVGIAERKLPLPTTVLPVPKRRCCCRSRCCSGP